MTEEHKPDDATLAAIASEFLPLFVAVCASLQNFEMGVGRFHESLQAPAPLSAAVQKEHRKLLNATGELLKLIAQCRESFGDTVNKMEAFKRRGTR